MHPRYDDILAAAGREPDWFSESGVPRFGPFHPTMLGVYDHSAIYGLLGCQGCDSEIPVALGTPVWSFYDLMRQDDDIKPWDAARLRGEFHYGDAPHHDYPGGNPETVRGCSGTTMGTWLVEVLEAWEIRSNPDGDILAQRFGEWTRVPELEGPVPNEMEEA